MTFEKEVMGAPLEISASVEECSQKTKTDLDVTKEDSLEIHLEREQQLGITEFVRKEGQGFTGILKER
jgi:hypothetical protein